jgi:hypothetical protein
MPYFVYKLTDFPLRQLELQQQFGSFKEASAQAKILRNQLVAGDKSTIKVIFAETELHAEDLLSQVREPQPLTGEDY